VAAEPVMTSRPLPYLASVFALAALYFGAAKLGLSLAFEAEQVSVVWPPSGIALAALLLFGYRLWPGIALGAFLANATTPHEPAWVAGGITVGNTLAAVLGAWLLHRLVGFRTSLVRLKDVLGLVVLAAGISTMVSATLGVTSLCLGRAQEWPNAWALWRHWWLGDAIGVLIVAPVLLTWGSWDRIRWQPRRVIEAVVLLIGLGEVCILVFAGGPGSTATGHPLEYTLFPFVVWAALRFGPRAWTSVTLVTATIAVLGTVNNSGPFAGGSVEESLILLDLYMAVVAVTALLLGATIAERRRLEAALREADRRKDEFLAMLAHELRNPLAPIRNAVEVLRHTRDDPERLESLRAVMERQVGHMVRLVEDLLDLSRITRGKVSLRRERLDLGEVVHTAVETSRPLIEAGRHELVLTPPPRLHVEGDRMRLAQVLANLLNNAAKYTPKGGRIGLAMAREADQAVLRVQDNGIGIPANMLPRVFDMFLQVDQDPERAHGGLGIGLTLVRSLVEMHGGTVEAHSAGAGQGSEFVVRLPLASLTPGPS
jgi:signal transduction histidine kinase